MLCVFLRRQTRSAVSEYTLWILGLCLPLSLLRQLRRDHMLYKEMLPPFLEGKVSLECSARWLFTGMFCFVMAFWSEHTYISLLSCPCASLSGRHCESVIDVCPRKPCQNGGTCAVASNMPDGFICQCPPVSTVSSHCSACLSSAALWLDSHWFTVGEHRTLFTHIPYFIYLAGKPGGSRCPRRVMLPVVTPNKYGLEVS